MTKSLIILSVENELFHAMTLCFTCYFLYKVVLSFWRKNH